jgi:hypothetical protein
MLAALLPGSPTEATVGQHPDSEVFGSDQAVIFSPIGKKVVNVKIAMERVIASAEAHQYKVQTFTDDTEVDLPVKPTDDKPSKATARNFLALSGKGLVFITSHIQVGHCLLVEAYGTQAARDAAMAGYAKKNSAFAAGELDTMEFTDHLQNTAYGICITKAGIQKHFKDRDSIVHLAACCSLEFSGAFGAREFFGYLGSVDDAAVKKDTDRLWARMHGELDSGHKRAATVAYEGGAGYSPGFKHVHRGTLETVLSPAVRLHVPKTDESFVVPKVVAASVNFDARMDTKVPAGQVIGKRDDTCDAKITDPKWASDTTLTFGLELNRTGEVTLVVNAKKARGQRAAGDKQDLDGNNDGAGPDHIGPNQDNFAWKVRCVTQDTPTPTPSPSPTGTRTPTASETPTATPTETATESPTATDTPSPSATPSEEATAAATGTAEG